MNEFACALTGKADNLLLNDIWTYCESSNAWEHLVANGPSGRFSHSAAVVGGKLYVFGGFDGISVTNELWVYSPGMLWSPLVQPLLSEAYHVLCKCFQVLGANGKMMMLCAGIFSWSLVEGTGAPSPRAGHKAAGIGTNMYIFGGADEDSFTEYNEIYKFDTGMLCVGR